MASSSSLSSCCLSGEDNEPSCLMGFIVAKIVCMRYYRGKITDREDIRLVRQPLNPHDGNVIAVFNRRGGRDGSVAAVVSPLMDSHVITAVQAIVPKSASRSRSCQLHLLARPDAFPAVLAAIRDGGLHLIDAQNSELVLSDSESTTAK